MTELSEQKIDPNFSALGEVQPIWSDEDFEAAINLRPSSELSDQQKDLLIALIHDIGSFNFGVPITADSYEQDMGKLAELIRFRQDMDTQGWLENFLGEQKNTSPLEKLKILQGRLNDHLKACDDLDVRPPLYYIEQALEKTVKKALENSNSSK